VLNCLCVGDDCEETALENVYYTSCAIRGYKVGRVRWDRAVGFEGGVRICETWEEEEDDEAARHCREIQRQVVVIYSDNKTLGYEITWELA
jgi:hypothetical protein